MSGYLVTKYTSIDIPKPLEVMAAKGCLSQGQENSKEAFDGVDACNRERALKEGYLPHIGGIAASIIVTNEGIAVCCSDEDLGALTGQNLKMRKLKREQIQNLAIIKNRELKPAPFLLFDEQFLEEYLGKKNLAILLEIKSPPKDLFNKRKLHSAKVIIDIVMRYLNSHCISREQKIHAISNIILTSQHPKILDLIYQELKKLSLEPKLNLCALMSKSIAYNFNYQRSHKTAKWGAIGKLLQNRHWKKLHDKEARHSTGASIVSNEYVDIHLLARQRRGGRKLIVYNIDQEELTERKCQNHIDYTLANC